jgi:hypothetical protein
MSDTIEIIIREEGSSRKIEVFRCNLNDKQKIMNKLRYIQEKYGLNNKDDWLDLNNEFFK